MPSARPLRWDSASAPKELTGYGGGEHRTGTIFHQKHSESTIQAWLERKHRKNSLKNFWAVLKDEQNAVGRKAEAMQFSVCV